MGYWFRDDTAGNGYFELNGVAQPAGAWITFTPRSFPG